MLFMPLGKRPDAKRREKPLFIQHPRKDAAQFLLIADAEEIATLRARQV
jgi:hypothetical protein